MGKYNPAMITLAREACGLTQTELAVEKLRVPQGTLSKWESGALAMTEEAISTLAMETEFPVSFFQQTDQIFPFGSTTFYHRRLQSVPAGTLRRIEARVNIYRFQIMRLLKATDMDKRCRFRRIDPDDCGGGVEEVAGLIRAAWHLPSGPIKHLIQAIEDAGGIVLRFDFGTSKMFGLSEWNPPAPPLFFLNDNAEISADRDRFTLAHELGHIIMHALPNPDMEKQANRFAGEFLMPAKEIRPHLNAPLKLHSVARLKPFWKVSMDAVIERAVALGVISENQHAYLRIQLQKKGYGHREPRELDIEREQPALLMEIIQAHVKELGFGYSDIAAMVNATPPRFRSDYGLDEIGNTGMRVIR